jgi:NAD(P)H-dependent FMN reductase
MHSKKLNMKVAIIAGSIRKGRQSFKVAQYLKQKLEERQVETNLIDLVKDPIPLFEDWSGYEAAVEKNISDIGDQLDQADAFILVTPEYHGSFSGVLKNALDFFWKEFQKKPVGVAAASTGKMGGINASTQLQHVILSLGAFPLPVKFLVPEVHQAFDDATRPTRDAITPSATKFLDDFLWFAEAIYQKQASIAEGDKVA